MLPFLCVPTLSYAWFSDLIRWFFSRISLAESLKPQFTLSLNVLRTLLSINTIYNEIEYICYRFVFQFLRGTREKERQF
jgi:hypothetical protein